MRGVEAGKRIDLQKLETPRGVGPEIDPSGVAASERTLGGLAPSPTRSGEPKGSGVAPQTETTGRLVVRYADGVTDDQRSKLRAANGLELASAVALPRTEVVIPAAGLVQAPAQP